MALGTQGGPCIPSIDHIRAIERGMESQTYLNDRLSDGETWAIWGSKWDLYMECLDAVFARLQAFNHC